MCTFADNVWWSTGEHTPHSWRHHPHPDAPRCIPCHYDDSAHVIAADATIPSFKAIKGCPCTPELLCAHNNHSDHMSEDWFNKYCDMPRLPYHMYSMHGGAGALMSIGLMRRVSWDFVEPCVLKTYSTGTSAVVIAQSVVYIVTVFCVGWAGLCCAVLCCAVLCCAVLCCAGLMAHISARSKVDILEETNLRDCVPSEHLGCFARCNLCIQLFL